MSSNNTLNNIFGLVAATHEKAFFGLLTRVEPLAEPQLVHLDQLLRAAVHGDDGSQCDPLLRGAFLKAQAALVKYEETPEVISVPVYKSWVTDPIDASKAGAVDHYVTQNNNHARDKILVKMQRQLYAALKNS